MKKDITGTISKINFKVKNGKLKINRISLKKEVMDELVSPEIRKRTKGADNVSKFKRKETNKENRKEAHDPVADAKAKISKDVAQNMGLKIS